VRIEYRWSVNDPAREKAAAAELIRSTPAFDGPMWRATVTQNKQEKQNANDLCGWMGVEVRPMTAAFAASLGMALPYGAILDQPEPGSSAANAHIEQGDVLTAQRLTADALK